MTVRGKFHCTGKDEHNNVTFNTVYDDSIPEDRRFAEATPNGQLKMLINNPRAMDQFEVGKSYYLDLTRID